MRQTGTEWVAPDQGSTLGALADAVGRRNRSGGWHELGARLVQRRKAEARARISAAQRGRAVPAKRRPSIVVDGNVLPCLRNRCAQIILLDSGKIPRDKHAALAYI